MPTNHWDFSENEANRLLRLMSSDIFKNLTGTMFIQIFLEYRDLKCLSEFSPAFHANTTFFQIDQKIS